jgi:hypothetical protein
MLWCLDKTMKYSSAACADEDEIMRAYIEIVATVCSWRFDLDPFDLWTIGEFTREDISSWLDKCPRFEIGVYGYEDFHAVCGDIDIPWATEEARRFAPKLFSQF